MKILLANAPWSKPGFYGVRAGSRWPHFEAENLEYMPFPFFMAYATALLERHGYDVSLIDAVAEALDEQTFYARVEQFAPELIVLEVSTISIDVDLRHVSELHNRLPGAKIGLCGLHSYMYEPEFLAEHNAVDMVLIGEYETTLLELVQRLESGAQLDGCRGLVHRRNGDVQVEKRRPLIEDLDSLPWPARHFLPMHDYHDEPGYIPRPSVQMWSSRGCPFGCIFCAWPQIMYGSRRYRKRSVVDTVDEMEWLVRRAGFKSVYFDDDTFNIDRKRTLMIADEIKRRRIGVPWAIMARADLMDEQLLTALRESGLHSLKYGVESASPDLIRTCDKRLDLDKVKRMVRLSHELGISTHLTFMFGLPGETIDTARSTIDLALELAPESLQFTIATPFPGSRYHRMLSAEGKIVQSDFSRYDGFRSAVVRTDELSAEQLEQICCEANELWNDFWYARAHPDLRTTGEKVRDLIKQPSRIPGAAKRLVKNSRTS
ncbi:MAG: radical SAM protein [Candidatus Alcyoniella australis]|nr:radical SAM protein [Candidatus Alcyoniella australis]